jgi:hypothetical protein
MLPFGGLVLLCIVALLWMLYSQSRERNQADAKAVRGAGFRAQLQREQTARVEADERERPRQVRARKSQFRAIRPRLRAVPFDASPVSVAVQEHVHRASQATVARNQRGATRPLAISAIPKRTSLVRAASNVCRARSEPGRSR